MRRVMCVLAMVVVPLAAVGCSNDDGDDGDEDTGTMMTDTGGDASMSSDTGGAADGDQSSTCTSSNECRQMFDNKPVCDFGAPGSTSGSCRACELSNECPGTTVCWTGADPAECVTDCEDDMSVCESGEMCKEIMESDGTTVFGCVPSS